MATSRIEEVPEAIKMSSWPWKMCSSTHESCGGSCKEVTQTGGEKDMVQIAQLYST